jgi:hypothetical protein
MTRSGCVLCPYTGVNTSSFPSNYFAFTHLILALDWVYRQSTGTDEPQPPNHLLYGLSSSSKTLSPSTDEPRRRRGGALKECQGGGERGWLEVSWETDGKAGGVRIKVQTTGRSVVNRIGIPGTSRQYKFSRSDDETKDQPKI